MFDGNWLAILPSKYQEIGCSSLSFDYTCKIRDGTELEYLQLSRWSLSTHPPIITQKPGVQASSLLHSPPEKLSVRGRDITAAFIQWPSSFEALKKTVQISPIDFNREMHRDTTGMYEKQIESADLLYVADSEQTRLRNERVRTHFLAIKC